MYYIRLLSPPKVSAYYKVRVSVTFVIAVTTDLGDQCFPDELQLIAQLVDSQDHGLVLHTQSLIWQAHSQVLKVSVQFEGKCVSRPVCLRVAQLSPLVDVAAKGLPAILDVRSMPFYLADKQRAESFVQREILLSNHSLLRIREETGDSIARHIWDASLGFLEYFDQAVKGISSSSDLSRLINRRTGRPLRVIELGAGCGIVGIAFAQMIKSSVSLTDLDDATTVLKSNIKLATLVHGSSLTHSILDWSQNLDTMEIKPDLILVSDCIYNPESSVHLVKTLQRLTKKMPSALILVGYKQRHEDDQVFFKHMQQAQFRISNTRRLQLPLYQNAFSEHARSIEFYEYHLHSE